MKMICVMVLFVLGSALNAQQEIDRGNSKVEFTATNLGLDVDGKILGLSGTINFNPDALDESSISAKLPVKGIRTENSKRDQHLQEEDFFYAEKYPHIIMESVSFEKSAAGFTARMRLTMRGATKEIDLPFTVEDGVFKGEFVVDRQDFNVGDDGFIDTVGDEVSIRIEAHVK